MVLIYKSRLLFANQKNIKDMVGFNCWGVNWIFPFFQDLNMRLKKLINAADVMLFMKGTPAEPRCGKAFI